MNQTVLCEYIRGHGRIRHGHYIGFYIQPAAKLFGCRGKRDAGFEQPCPYYVYCPVLVPQSEKEVFPKLFHPVMRYCRIVSDTPPRIRVQNPRKKIH